MTEFGSLNMAELAEENDRLDQQGGGGDYLENFVRMPEKEGFVTVRLLPPAKGKKFFCATRTHRVNGRSIHCPRILVRNKTGGQSWVDEDPKKPCQICKYYGDLWKESETKEGKAAEELQNQARAIKPVERYYYNCIARSQVNKNNEVEKNVGPKILSIGKTLHQRIVRAIVGDPSNEEKPLGDITDVKNGRDFKIIKKILRGANSYPNYDESKFQDPSPLGEKDQVETWMANLHELAELRVLKSAEEMKLELKKHLGLIQDKTTGYDPTEFQKPRAGVTLAEQVRQTQPEVSAKPTPAQPDPSDVALAEADFMAEMEELKKL